MNRKWLFIGLVPLAALLLLLRPSRNGEIALLRGHDGVVRDVAFSPDGTLVASAGDDGSARVWKASDFSALHRFEAKGKVRTVAFIPKSNLLASSGDDRLVHLWNLETGLEKESFPVSAKVDRLAVHPDGTHLAAGTLDGQICVWNLADAKNPVCWKTAGRHVHGLVFSVSGKTLFSGDDKGNLQAWDWRKPKQTDVQSLGKQHIHDLTANIGGVLVAMAGKGVLSCPLSGLPPKPLNEASGMALTADATTGLVASGHEDGAVKWWKPTGDPLPFTAKLKHPVLRVRFSPDGNLTAAACGDGVVHVWRSPGP